MDRTLLSLGACGECEQHAKFEDDTPCGLGVLPDGKLVVLTMFRKRLMTYTDGQLSLYADLSGIATGAIDDMIVDGLGRAYVMKAPDGICLDQEEAVCVASFNEDAFIRVGRDGRELQRMEVPGRRAIACVLGGPARRTLFCLSAATSPEQLRQRKSSARIDAVDVEIPGAGYP
jgi:sugar lactone lactonase YvrE